MQTYECLAFSSKEQSWKDMVFVSCRAETGNCKGWVGILAVQAPITLKIQVTNVFLADFCHSWLPSVLSHCPLNTVQFAVSRSLQLCHTTKIVALFSQGLFVHLFSIFSSFYGGFGLGFGFGVLDWVFLGWGFSVDGVWGLWCEAFLGFWGLSSLH